MDEQSWKLRDLPGAVSFFPSLDLGEAPAPRHYRAHHFRVRFASSLWSSTSLCSSHVTREPPFTLHGKRNGLEIIDFLLVFQMSTIRVVFQTISSNKLFKPTVVKHLRGKEIHSFMLECRLFFWQRWPKPRDFWSWRRPEVGGGSLNVGLFFSSKSVTATKSCNVSPILRTEADVGKEAQWYFLLQEGLSGTLQRLPTDIMKVLAFFSRKKKSLYVGRVYDRIQLKVYKKALCVQRHYWWNLGAVLFHWQGLCRSLRDTGFTGHSPASGWPGITWLSS